MERPDVEQVLDLLANNHEHGWDLHREDNCHIWIRCNKAAKPPHARINKQTGTVQALGKTRFMLGGVDIGYIVSCEDFIRLVTKKDE